MSESKGRNTSEKYCLVGAGAAGLATCHAFLQYGVPFDCFEREDDIGGNFHYGKPHASVYKSTHLLSSKQTTQFPDYPMPENYPHYPHHSLVLDYFRNYAEHFGLRQHIQFNSAVEWIERQDDGWSVQLQNGRSQCYRGVIIANGHHWCPLLPDFPGQFNGRILHAKDYRTPDIFEDKRVLVVGAGNSACDIVLDAVPVARSAVMSMRRSVHFLSKLCFGRPGDVTLQLMGRLRLPMWLRRSLVGFSAWMINGRPQDIGLPAPDHRIFDANPTVNSMLPYRIGHGDVRVRPNIARLDGDRVEFTDGSAEEFDVIVYATGYRVSVPFISESDLNWQQGMPQLFLNQFHPQRDDLAMIGLFQSASGGHWGLMHYQAQLLARFLAAKNHGAQLDWFRQLRAGANPDLRGGFARVRSERHSLTVDPVLHQRYLERLICRFNRYYDLPVDEEQTPVMPVAQTPSETPMPSTTRRHVA